MANIRGRRTTSLGVAILGGMRPPSWRRIRETCMVNVLDNVRMVSETAGKCLPKFGLTRDHKVSKSRFVHTFHQYLLEAKNQDSQKTQLEQISGITYHISNETDTRALGSQESIISSSVLLRPVKYTSLIHHNLPIAVSGGLTDSQKIFEYQVIT